MKDISPRYLFWLLAIIAGAIVMECFKAAKGIAPLEAVGLGMMALGVVMLILTPRTRGDR